MAYQDTRNPYIQKPTATKFQLAEDKIKENGLDDDAFNALRHIRETETTQPEADLKEGLKTTSQMSEDEA